MSDQPASSTLAEAPPSAARRRFENLPIKRKLALITLVTSTIPLLLVSAGFIAYEGVTLRKEAVAELAATGETLVTLSAPLLARDDASGAAELLQGLRGRPSIQEAQLLDRRGGLVASFPPGAALPLSAYAPAEESTSVRFVPDRIFLGRSIASNGTPVGSLVLVMDRTRIRERLQRFAWLAGATILLTIAGAYALASRLQHAISARLNSLAALAGRVAKERDFSVRAPRAGNDEVDRVIDGFNEMLAQLQLREAALQSAHDDLEQRVQERTRALLREQARFKGIFDAAPVGFTWSVVGDVSTRIVNPAHEAITGVSGASARELGRYRDATHPDDRGKQDELHAKLVAGEIDHYEVEKRYVHPDGSIHWVALTVRFYRDEGTGVLQEINTAVDITERRRAEAGWAEASKLLDTMLENTPDFIYFKDRESRFVRFSNAFLARFNLAAPGALVGKTDFDLFSREHADQAFADEQEIIRTGQPIIGKIEQETYPGGRATWAMSTKMPWRDGNGAIIGTFGISKDVTPLKEAEARAAYEGELLRMLLENVLDKIYFKDLESRFVRVSRSKVVDARRVLRAFHAAPGAEAPSYLQDDRQFESWLIGKTDADIVGAERARHALAEEREIIRTGIPVVNRVEHVAMPDGTEEWHLVTKMPWRGKNGEIIGTFGTTHNITAMKEAEAKLAETHKKLVESSRHAGMAEVATGVLHNVGNVLNSVNVSATLVAEQVRHTKALNVAKLASLFEQNRGRIGDFMTSDSRGKMIPDYLSSLAEAIASEQKAIAQELENLRKNIEHIKDIVAMQQAYASTSGVIETVSVPDMIEDALRMNSGSLARHDVMTVRDYQARGVVTTDKHKVIQILINLVRNAKYACDESGRTDKQIVVRTTSDEHGVKISVIDNGVGIPPQNLTRVFEHGFTTRRHGHGFGLHSGALAAKELGGSLTAHSDGPGHGATFTLALPYKTEPARP